ncbi:hypothetical protein QZM52_15205, partial [Burkholderia metallica]
MADYPRGRSAQRRTIEKLDRHHHKLIPHSGRGIADCIDQHVRMHFRRRNAKTPAFRAGVSGLGSLTITYFHTGIRTIIGVESF